MTAFRMPAPLAWSATAALPFLGLLALAAGLPGHDDRLALSALPLWFGYLTGYPLCFMTAVGIAARRAPATILLDAASVAAIMLVVGGLLTVAGLWLAVIAFATGVPALM